MRIPQSRFILLGIIFTMGLAACNLPASPDPSATDTDPSVDYTAAAETIIAQLTEVAETLTPTSPGDAPEERQPPHLLPHRLLLYPPVIPGLD